MIEEEITGATQLQGTPTVDHHGHQTVGDVWGRILPEVSEEGTAAKDGALHGMDLSELYVDHQARVLDFS